MTTYRFREAPENSELLVDGDVEEPLDIICFGEIVITLNIIDGKRWRAVKDIINTEKCLRIEKAGGEFDVRSDLSGVSFIKHPKEERTVWTKPLDSLQADIIKILGIEFEFDFPPVILFTDIVNPKLDAIVAHVA